MRRLVVLLLVLGLVPLAVLGTGPGAVVEVEIENMTCPVCARTVGERLSALPGVQDVKISLKTDTARVVMASGQKPDVERIRQVVNDAGFEAGAVTVTPEGKGAK